MNTVPDIRVTITGEDQSQQDVSKLSEDQRVPPPRYRHAAPSAPWPWMDFDKDDANVAPPSPSTEQHWGGYPKSHFGNWTKDQVDRCRMLTICQKEYPCLIHKVDVFKGGNFDKPEGANAQPRVVHVDDASAKKMWDELQGPPDPNLRVRALFIENITLNVLQILGAKYNIEPFFFASSANWIPSRYQEDPHEGKEDHITVVLPFVRAVNNQLGRGSPAPSNETPPSQEGGLEKGLKGPEKRLVPLTDTEHIIDTQAPLVLSNGKVLLQDLLAIHMVRNTEDNVIISYHHHSELQKTTAKRLQSLVQRTGDSVYWSKLYKKSRDPTFLFLAILWYALYAWDEAFEVLYAYLSAKLESSDSIQIKHTQELHKLQAHLLYYQQLLRDFEKSVEFVRDTPNPAMDKDPGREDSMQVLKRESMNLLSEIERLEKQRQVQSDRLKNAIDLSFSTVNIVDSKSMQKLSKATLRDSAAMKQISYLTMIFLPATYLSSVFGMNVREINPGTLKTLATYIESTVILTVITVWLVIALQAHSSVHEEKCHIVKRFAWPVFYGYAAMQQLMAAAGKVFLGRRSVDNHPEH